MLYIILPVHNRIATTSIFIRCLLEQTFSEYLLLLVDDGSTDGTAEFVQKEISKSTVIKGDGSLWWAGGLQKGLDWIKQHGDPSGNVLMINDDVRFENDFLARGVGLLSKHSNTLILAQAYSEQSGQLVDTGVHLSWDPLKFRQAESVEKINCLSTRGLFLKVKDAVRIGDFHPILLPHYLSDYEYTYRAYKKGFRLITDSSLSLLKNEETTGFSNSNYRSVLDIWRKYFSKKNPNNIIYFTNFIVLAGEMPILAKEVFSTYILQFKTLAKNFGKLF